MEKNHSYLIFTFDDGPRPVMPEIAAAFEEFGGRASFFVLGKNINEETAEYIRTVQSRGHEICNHGQNHSFGDEGYETIYDELQDGFLAIRSCLPQYRVKFYRSPGNRVNDTLLEVLGQEFSVCLINRTFSLRDWDAAGNNEADLLRLADEQLENGKFRDGAIINLHEVQRTLNILPQLLKKLYDLGFRFCTLTEYLAIREIPLERLPKNEPIRSLSEFRD